MRRKQFFSCLLLGYLVLLLNFGPSLHRAHFFGLHSHQVDDSAISHASCCHSHAPPCGAQDSQSETVKSEHVCAICHFFDHFQVIDCEVVFAQVTTLAFLNDFVKPAAVPAAILNPTARGPPSIV